MTKNFNVLRAKRSPEARARARVLANKYEAEMALDELREARALTQVNLAEILGVNQPAISKMERQTDMYVSTLRSIVRAMGGHLRVEAVFPEGRVEISQFKQLAESPEPEPAKKPAKQTRSRQVATAASR
jgi:transcriptional regulator with XRE-family HTH domain